MIVTVESSITINIDGVSTILSHNAAEQLYTSLGVALRKGLGNNAQSALYYPSGVRGIDFEAAIHQRTNGEVA